MNPQRPNVSASGLRTGPVATEGLDLLVRGLFDYAGMFPPASLPFDQALAESARAGSLHRPHIVGTDLVLDLKDLARLDASALRAAAFPRDRCTVCAVGATLEHLPEAVRRVIDSNHAHAGDDVAIHVTTLEVAAAIVPGEPVLAAARDALAVAGVRLYIEPRWNDVEWRNRTAGLLARLDGLNVRGRPVGLKVRGSGPTAVSHDTLARLIPDINRRALPFKATAGLHHPVCGDGDDARLGFLNLAAALRLQRALGADGLPFADLVALLGERDPAAFRFDGGVAWRGRGASLDAVRAAAQAVPLAVGSCSLSDPDGDMARLWP